MSRLGFNLSFWSKFLTRAFDDYSPDVENLINKEQVDYYCKLSSKTKIENSISYSQINLFKNSGYSYDLYNILYPFRREIKFHYLAGDITTVPSQPTFLKSRPIDEMNINSVLLPLDSHRHFRFVDDKKEFNSKINGMVWRGAAYQVHRKEFLNKCYHLSSGNFGNTAVSKNKGIQFQRPRMSIKQQLEYKFIISLEGNDVASNLKWILSSNSVCMMPKPKFESWFSEGKLVANKHYIEIKDDYSDLEERFEEFNNDIDACEHIIKNANKFTREFYSKRKMLEIARMTAMKYMEFTDA